MARLAWPGYTATIDGKPVEVQDGEAGLIKISVPPGSHVLDLKFTAPGLRLGWIVLFGATLIVLAQSVWLWIINRRRRRAATTATEAESPEDSAEPELIPAGATAEQP